MRKKVKVLFLDGVTELHASLPSGTGNLPFLLAALERLQIVTQSLNTVAIERGVLVRSTLVESDGKPLSPRRASQVLRQLGDGLPPPLVARTVD